jgi:hypothetical protein
MCNNYEKRYKLPLNKISGKISVLIIMPSENHWREKKSEHEKRKRWGIRGRWDEFHAQHAGVGGIQRGLKPNVTNI